MSTTSLARPTTCIWCKRRITDGRNVSGFTGEGPDWMDDGDFGCDPSPDSTSDSVGRHIGRSSLRDYLAGRDSIYAAHREPLTDGEVKALMERI